MTPSLDTILGRLRGVKKTRTGWVALCPAHEDQKPSLSIGEGHDGKPLLHCHAGCTFDAIMRALGITGHPQPEAKGLPPDAHKTWIYKDAFGNPVLAVCRWDSAGGKRLAQFRHTRAGWEPGSVDPPRPCYRLPELLRAPDSIWLWVVEGEKCVDALAGAGQLATTSAGGAKAAGRSDWSWAKGRRIAIWPDYDSPGFAYARDVAALVRDAGAACVWVLDPRKVGLQAGQDAADTAPSTLRAILAEAGNEALALDGPAEGQLAKACSTSTGTKAAELKPTDLDLARLWAKECGLAIWSLGTWWRWDGARWREWDEAEVGDSVLRIIEPVCRAAGLSISASRLFSVQQIAKTLLFRAQSWWDAAKEYWVAGETAIRLSDCSRIRAGPETTRNMIAAPYAYNPDAVAPTWLSILEQNVNDTETVEFLQDFAGYCLTGETQHEVAVWLYGPPGTGKSTIVAGFEALLGEACVPLGLHDIERTPFAVGRLLGKRLAVATEQPAEFVSCGHLLAQIISGEPITVDRKYREPITIQPEAKLLWACNELPRVAEAHSGLFRRLAIISFAHKPDKPDATLKARLKREAPGILNWALAGLGRLRQRGGFALPQRVLETVNEYRESCDVIGHFAQERLEFTDIGSLESGELYREYRAWCEENGHKAKSSTAVAVEWQRIGLKRARIRSGTVYYGARIKNHGVL